MLYHDAPLHKGAPCNGAPDAREWSMSRFIEVAAHIRHRHFPGPAPRSHCRAPFVHDFAAGTNSAGPRCFGRVRRVIDWGIALKTDDLRQRRLPIGAEIVRGRGVEFRVWAPRRTGVDVVLESMNSPRIVPLEAEGNGYFSGLAGDASAGTRYRYRLDGADRGVPDPASRFQPEGPHGASEVVDASAFPWTDPHWRGVAREGQVIYEMHVGTFTPEGTWRAAARELPELARLGVTVIEMMPVADFGGDFRLGLRRR